MEKETSPFKAFVLGSCVTRDCFEVSAEKSLACVDYFARTSLASLMAPARPLGDLDFDAGSNFARKAIHRDFDKSFFATLGHSDFDVLIIDLIDERFGLVELEGSCVTQSHEFEKSGLLAREGGTRLNRFSARVDTLWREAAILFCSRISSIANGRPVVLHRAMWADRYLDKTGEVVPFEGAWLDKISANNKILTGYYDFLKSEMPDVFEISIENAIAHEEHKWGLHAIHYLPAYYAELYRRLEVIAKMKSLNPTRA